MIKNNQKKLTLHKGILLGIAYLIPFLIMTKDSQVYFYSSFIYYSLASFVLICFLVFYISKVSKSLLSIYCLSMAIVIISSLVWLVPKVLHYTVLENHAVCLKSTVTQKYWHRYGGTGYIDFKVDQNITIPKKLMSFNTLTELSEYEYDMFPLEGNNILICGEISKVGYTFTHIEPIKEPEFKSKVQLIYLKNHS